MAILEMLAKGLSIVSGWLTSYTSKKNAEARVIENEKDKKDDFNNELKNNDLDSARKRLS